MELDKEDLAIAANIHRLDQEIMHQAKVVADKYRDRLVVINSGWRKGEKGAKARITGAIAWHGRLAFLCMAINKRGEIINGDAWTREYRHASDFDLVLEGKESQ